MATWLAAANVAGKAPQPQAPPEEDEGPDPGPFAQGRFRASLGGGTGNNFGESYFVIGLGVGYFVIDGLELGFDFETWLGGEPMVTTISPEARYIFFQVPYLHPYLGALYRHWFIADNLDDIDAIGGRLGLFMVTGGSLFVGGGVVYERIVSACDEDCDNIYPELVFSITF